MENCLRWGDQSAPNSLHHFFLQQGFYVALITSCPCQESTWAVASSSDTRFLSFSHILYQIHHPLIGSTFRTHRNLILLCHQHYQLCLGLESVPPNWPLFFCLLILQSLLNSTARVMLWKCQTNHVIPLNPIQRENENATSCIWSNLSDFASHASPPLHHSSHTDFLTILWAKQVASYASA